MRSNVLQKLVAVGAATLLSGSVFAQQAGPGGPGGGRPGGRGGPGGNGGPGGDATSIVDRMMSFDANHDGKLTKEEVTDQRLQRVFERADADKDGVVTKEELTTLAAQLQAERQQNGAGGPGSPVGGGPGGRGGPGGFGGRGGGPEGMPQPGQVLPDRLREMLNLTAEQRTQLDELQKEVDAKLAKILTDDQKKQLEQLRQRGPRQGGGGGRAPGGPGGGGPGGAGGRPGGGPGPQRAGGPEGGL